MYIKVLELYNVSTSKFLSYCTLKYLKKSMNKGFLRYEEKREVKNKRSYLIFTLDLILSKLASLFNSEYTSDFSAMS